MVDKSPKPSEIIEAIYDFCEPEKDISKMSLQEVNKALLTEYAIKSDESVSKIKMNIAKIKAKSTLKEAAARRIEQLKNIPSAITNAIRNLKPEEARIQLPNLLGVQAEFAFRNFNSCSEQDLTSMATDLKILEDVALLNESFQANDINPKAVAYQLTRLFVITEPKEIDLEAIAMERGVLVINGPLEGCDARLIRKGEKGVIRVSDSLTVGQRRFAIAHELGHWEMHRGISQWHLCTNENLASYKSSEPELQASSFASELLLPTKLLRPLCAEVEPNMELVCQLADSFCTGLIATALRFIELNENPCLVVLSDGNRIKWWKKNDHCRNAWFESKQEIGQEALAAKCSHENKPSGKSVPYSAWFKHIESNDRETVFEQSMKLGRFNSVLSLLWFD